MRGKAGYLSATDRVSHAVLKLSWQPLDEGAAGCVSSPPDLDASLRRVMADQMHLVLRKLHDTLLGKLGDRLDDLCIGRSTVTRISTPRGRDRGGGELGLTYERRHVRHLRTKPHPT